MDRKILISLQVPSLAERYDVYLPVFLTVEQVTALLVRAVIELSANRYVTSGQELLCYQEGDRILAPARKIRDYGIKNGDHMMLF